MDRLQGRADCMIYNDIVKKICTGIYRFESKLPPIRTLCMNYGFAATTVKKALKRLRQDGFIVGETSNGTRIVFDCANLRHIENLKAIARQAAYDPYNDFEIPVILLSCLISVGAASCTESTRKAFAKDIDKIMQKLDEDSPRTMLTESLMKAIIAQTGNPYFIDVFEDITNQAFLFVPPTTISIELNARYRQIIRSYYSTLKVLLLAGDSEKIIHETKEMCTALSKISNVILINLSNQNMVEIHTEKLYSRVVQDILIDILSGHIEKGTIFITTPQACKKYGISRKTISKAYGILESLKLIEVIPYKGVRLIADQNDVETQKWMQEKLKEWSREIIYAQDVFHTIGFSLFAEAARHVTDEIVTQIEQNLDKQWKGVQKYNTALFITDAVIEPLLSSIRSNMIHQQYEFLVTPLVKFITIVSFYMQNYQFNQKDVYEAALHAVEALKDREVETFIDHLSEVYSYVYKMYEPIKIDIDEDIAKRRLKLFKEVEIGC